LARLSIGGAPTVLDAVSKRLGARGFSDEEVVSAGLAGTSNRGGVIDKFRGRIIIPIRDQSGKAVGLGGRILPGLEGPKYLNSPSTPLFDKGRTLFAIDLAKTSIRKEKLSVIVEGYTDVMAAHQAGFTNVVASLGTALTRGQVELATRYADAVALAYDVDLAGEAATQRGLLEELGPDAAVSKVRVVRIPAGKDPDELIRTDPDAWRRAIADAKPVIEYFIDRAATEADLSTIAGRRDVTGRSLAILKRVGDRVERALYLQHLARLVNVEERTLGEALERAPVVRRARRSREPGNGASAQAPSLGTLESEALELMLRNPRLAGELPADEILPFAGAVARQLASALRERAATMSAGDGQADQGAALEEFVGGLDPATGAVARELLEAAALDSGEPVLDPVEAREVLRTCLLRLRVERLDEALRDGRLLLEEAQREGDHGRLEEIEQRIDRLGREKAEATRAMHTPATSLA